MIYFAESTIGYHLEQNVAINGGTVLKNKSPAGQIYSVHLGMTKLGGTVPRWGTWGEAGFARPSKATRL
jgi:hypothetical protein